MANATTNTNSLFFSIFSENRFPTNSLEDFDALVLRRNILMELKIQHEQDISRTKTALAECRINLVKINDYIADREKRLKDEEKRPYKASVVINKLNQEISTQKDNQLKHQQAITNAENTLAELHAHLNQINRELCSLQRHTIRYHRSTEEQTGLIP